MEHRRSVASRRSPGARALDLATFRALAAWTAASIVALVVTGGTVRLTGSGLGCADWPNCSRGEFVAPLRFHALVEDGNRFVGALATVLLAVTLVAAWRLTPRRRDLVAWSAALFGGILVQIGMGAVVVYSHLWPPFVMVHFLLSIVMVAAAVALHHRAAEGPSAPVPVVARELRMLVRAVVALTGLVIVAGTAVTGTGPHAGSPGAARLPLRFGQVTEVHAALVLALAGLMLGTLVACRITHVPERVERWAHRSLAVMVVQGLIGYVQYLTHVPALLVGVHLLGACVVTMCVVKLDLCCAVRPGMRDAVTAQLVYVGTERVTV